MQFIRKGNIKIEDEKLLQSEGDFGLAVKLSADNQQFITQNNFGSWLYQAPELYNSKETRVYTKKTDIFSVGCVLTLVDNYKNFFQPQLFVQNKNTFIYPMAFINMIQTNFNQPFDPSVFQDKQEKLNRKSQIYQYIQASVVFDVENRKDFSSLINQNLKSFYTNQVDLQKIINKSQKSSAPDLRKFKIINEKGGEKMIQIDINCKELKLDLYFMINKNKLLCVSQLQPLKLKNMNLVNNKISLVVIQQIALSPTEFPEYIMDKGKEQLNGNSLLAKNKKTQQIGFSTLTSFSFLGELQTKNLNTAMTKLKTLIFITILFTAGHGFVCDYTISPGNKSDGCVQDCKDFATFEEAQIACDADTYCRAITFSQKQNGGSASTGAAGNDWGYQLRQSVVVSPSSNQENTWVRAYCHHPLDSGFLEAQGYFIGGCLNDCQDFLMLILAQIACRELPECGGITFSKRQHGGLKSKNELDGNWGFQLRSGKSLSPSPNGETSWLVQSKEKPNQIYEQCTYQFVTSGSASGCAQNCKDFANLEDAKRACNADPNCNAITFSQNVNGGSESTGASGKGWGYQLRASMNVTSFTQEASWVKIGCQIVTTFPCFLLQTNQGTYLPGCFNGCQDFSSLEEAQNACINQQGCGGVTFSKKYIGGPNASNAFDGVWGYQLRESKSQISSRYGEDSWSKVCLSYPALFTGCDFKGKVLELSPNIDTSSLDLSLYHSLYIPPSYQVNMFSQPNQKGQAITYQNSVICLIQGFMQLADQPQSVSIEVNNQKNRFL
ncbi:hypothetical protein ABPG73_008168 [Tetrahymena malaccensis]